MLRALRRWLARFLQWIGIEMAVSKKISDLEPATTLTGAELVPIVQDDQTVRTTVNDFAN